MLDACRLISIHNNPENLKVPKGFQQLKMTVADVHTQDITPYFNPSYDFIEEARNSHQGTPLLQPVGSLDGTELHIAVIFAYLVVRHLQQSALMGAVTTHPSPAGLLIVLLMPVALIVMTQNIPSPGCQLSNTWTTLSVTEPLSGPSMDSATWQVHLLPTVEQVPISACTSSQQQPGACSSKPRTPSCTHIRCL